MKLIKDVDSSTSSSASALYKSRFRTEPTNVTAPQWQAALWSSLENLIEEMADCCIKVYTLEKVLTMKKDAVSQVVFLDEAMKVSTRLAHSNAQLDHDPFIHAGHRE